MTILLVVFVMCVGGVFAAHAYGVNVKAETVQEQRYKRQTTGDLLVVRTGKVCDQAADIHPELTCDDGWLNFGTSCYFYSTATYNNWAGAVIDCQNMGAYLVEIGSEAEDIFVTSEITGGRGFFIGLSDIDLENTWVWKTSGIELTTGIYAGWNSGEPNYSASNNDDCVSIYTFAQWNDLSCSDVRPYICEKAGPPSNECEASPCLNGGTCTDEAIGYTCACVNGYEGSNCETEPSCEVGWVYHDQSCYFFNAQISSQSDATTVCQSLGAYLVEIKSETESIFIESIRGDARVLLGLSRYGVDGWQWETSGTVLTTGDYTGWAPGQPDGATTGIYEGCALVHTSGWHDVLCSNAYESICEKAANCETNPCLNDGTCTDEAVGYTCACANGYEGINCETANCETSPCLNGATCTDEAVGYTCACANFYEGSNCETGIVANECEESPCLNGGTCADEAIGYTCACVNGYEGSKCETVLFTIETCSPDSVIYTVYVGQAGGVTYIEGSTDNCTHTLSGDASQSISTEYSSCGVDPANGTSSVIAFVIAVNGNAGYTTVDDARYQVECIFGENDNVVVTVEAGGKSKKLTENEVFNIANHPTAELTLYVKEDDTGNYVEITSDTVVSVGSLVRLELTLDTNISNYNVLIKSGSLEAKTLADELLKTMQLIDGTTFCSLLVAIFPDFQYSTKEVTIDGVTTIVPVASTEYVVFMPTIVGLADTQIKLVMTCTVAMCLTNNAACTQPTCGSRRRRAVESSIDDDYEEPVSKSFIFTIGNRTSNEEGDVTNTAQATFDDSESLTDRTVFWAILISSILVVVIGGFITCCVCMNLRRRDRNSKNGKETYEDRMQSKINIAALEHDGWSRRGSHAPRSMPRSAHAPGSMPHNQGRDDRYYY